MICYYDKNNLDSICAAAIVRHFNKDCELCDIAEFKLKPKRTVYMVGCSLAPEEMKKLVEVCDLHLCANTSEYSGFYTHGFSSPEYGVGELAWIYLSSRKFLLDRETSAEDITAWMEKKDANIPKAVQLIGAYATGRGDERAQAFSIGAEASDLMNLNHTFTWCTLLEDKYAGSIIDDMIGTGFRVLNYLQQQSVKVAEQGAFEWGFRTFLWEDGRHHAYYPCNCVRSDYPETWHRCICLNTTNHTKEAFDSVFNKEKHDLMIAFSMNSNQKWRLSFFGDKAEEVAQAIGNEVEVLPWTK